MNALQRFQDKVVGVVNVHSLTWDQAWNFAAQAYPELHAAAMANHSSIPPETRASLRSRLVHEWMEQGKDFESAWILVRAKFPELF